MSLIFIDSHTNVISGVSVPEFLLSSVESKLWEDVGLNQVLIVGLEHGPSGLGLHAKNNLNTRCPQISQKRNIPLSKESENEILTLIRQPGLTRAEHLHLMEIDLENFGCKGGYEMLREWAILRLHGAG